MERMSKRQMRKLLLDIEEWSNRDRDEILPWGACPREPGYVAGYRIAQSHIFFKLRGEEIPKPSEASE